MAAVLLALLPGTALAQEVGGDDRDRVMLWTLVAVVLSLVAASVGYAYRRTRGMDHPTPDELEMMNAEHGSHGEHGETPHGEAVHAHAEAEH